MGNAGKTLIESLTMEGSKEVKPYLNQYMGLWEFKKINYYKLFI